MQVRVATSHSRTVLWQLPVASSAPSGLNATDITSMSPARVIGPLRNRLVSRQRCTGWPELPLASDGAVRAERHGGRGALGPVRAAVQVWLATSHSRTRRPPLISDPSGLTPWSQPLASTLPSGLNATECTRPLWPVEDGGAERRFLPRRRRPWPALSATADPVA